MKNKIKYLILIIIAIAIMAIGSVLNAVTYEASGDKNKLTVLKEAYNADKPITQIGKTISISNTNLNSYLTLWCVQQGKSVGTDRTYKINTIINIGNYIKEGKAFSKAVSFFKKDGKDKEVSKTSFRIARLAYLIDKCKDYEKSNHEDYVPQDALWGHFDDWFKNNKDLFPDTWTMQNTIKTDEAKKLFANSLIYAKFAAEYDEHGKISVPNNYKEVTVSKSGNYYYAGPIKLNFSYYEETADDTTTDYASYRTLKKIGALKSIKNGKTNLTVTRSVGGTTVDINTIKPNEEFYVRMSSISDEVTVTVEQNEFNLVSARLWFLKEQNDAAQRLMVSASTRTEIKDDNCKATFKIKTTDVSLQKHITKVNDTEIKTNGEYTRINKYADTDENLETDKNHEGYDVSKNNSVTGVKNYKSANPVVIEAGDTVEYNITVYNNSNTETTVKVRDGLWPVINGNATIESTEAWLNGKKTNEKIEFKRVSGKDYYDIYVDEKNNFTLNGNDRRTFKIRLKYTQFVSGVQINTAWISDTSVHNRSQYRTYDREYIAMKQYSVSLEKFVSEVTDANDGNKQTYDRSGKRYNESLANGDTNKNVDKYNNRVPLEVGDKVTFTIRLKNTGDTPVKITQIYDSFRFEEAGTVNGLKLVYDSSYGIQGNGNGTITNDHYGDDKDNNNKKLDRYLIQFNNATLLNKDEHVDVTIRYTVEAPAELTASNHSLQNKAGILQLMNKNNISVSDSDGTDNNYDMDWVKIKPYKVSLKKYVSKVTDKNGQNEETYDRSATRLNYYAADKTNEDNYKTDKKDHPVLLESGDKVTYTIILKNEGDTPVKINKVYDFCSNKGLEYDGSSIQGNGGGEVTETASVNPHGASVENVTRHTIVFDNPVSIPANGTENVTITFNVISNISDASYCNVARILELKNNNNRLVADSDGTDNNTDEDWVKLKKYSVSLEKFVSEVTDANGGNKQTYDRDGFRINESLCKNFKIENKEFSRFIDVFNEYFDTKEEKIKDYNIKDNVNLYKMCKPAELEAGDKVTFTIRLKNTGDTSVKISQIYDSFRVEETGTVNGLKLVYDSSYGIQGNGNGTIINDHLGDDENNNNKSLDRYLIQFDNATLLNKNEYVDITIRYKVEVPKELSNSKQYLQNKAGIVQFKNRNEIIYEPQTNESVDSDGVENNYDMDWVKTKVYKVSLQKIVHSVNTTSTGDIRWKSWESKANVDNNPTEETYNQANLYAKHNNPVTVAKGDTVTYAIKVTNNHDTLVKNIKVKDTLPDGLDLKSVKIEKVTDKNGNEISNAYSNYNRKDKEITFTLNTSLNKNDSNIIYLSAIVTESNMSTRVLRNSAEIIGTMKNRNNEDVLDSTASNNNDADYIQMKDITISGMVWNDRASDKNADNYDGIYNDKQEDRKLSGITVKLYRQGKGVIAETQTNRDGKYSFSNSDIKTDVVTKPCERYIKAPYVCEDKTYTGDIECGKVTVEKVENGKVIETKECGANYWKEDNYYSYYVVFEYDGITYTSTKFADVTSENENDSNAREKLNTESYDGKVVQSRTAFNSRYDTINSAGAYKEDGNHNKYLVYNTENNDGYIPSSLYSFEKSYQHTINTQGQTAGYNGMLWTILMQSSTMKIDLSNDSSLEGKLQHVNLGLRGRDIFDLELTSDVDTVKVTVNNQQGVYRYSNKVNLRQADLYNEIEDMANIASEKSNTYVDRQDQNLRNSDFNIDTKNAKYSEKQGISNIEVTYKITVQNASNTVGTATKITNYYDSKYNINMKQTVNGTRYYYDKNGNLQSDAITGITLSDAKQSGTNYKSVLITIPETMLNQSDTMDIYVVYTLNTPIKDTLKGLTNKNSIPTYNMAEITEYKTKTIGGEVEYIRGLIDKDSAPGSANVETVRLASGTSDKTTVEYYFAAQNLQNLKYEDDTYATPTLYFVIPYDENRTEDIDGNTIENKYYNRIITGKVFRDETVTDATTKIKTGNGKLDEGEAPVYGATVELIEQVDGGKVRYTTTTGIDGSFRFSGFLPGNYVIRYYYGDTTNTVLLKQNGEVNAYSFNGEDYQATNNSYNLTVKNAQGRQLTTNILEKVEEAENFWYLYNENKGISTAKDDTTRRDKVSKNVIDTAKSDNIIRMLNAARAGENIAVGNIETQNSLIEQTYMFADTDSMLFTVEKTELVESKPKPIERFEAKYIVKDMNFGIAEIPVTTIDLQKEVQSFTITDVTGKNIIAQIEKNSEGKWINKKNVLPMDEVLDVSIEDEKLQGARLQVKYNIIADISVEKNYDGKEEVYATIGGLNDYIDNNLSYNEALGENSKYWEVVKDNNNTQYSTIVKATIDNPILSDGDGNKVATITLEKVLSSTDSTIDEIITSTVDIYEYNNTIKITQIKYNNCPEDKVRDLGRYIILAGEGGQHNGATAQTITIHPPTGDSSISTVYYIIAAISLAVLAAGVFGIKKFVVKK